DAELAEVSDDTPSVGRESVDLHTGRAFISASIEAHQDIRSLGEPISTVMADARDNLESTKFATGSGNGEPAGIWTRLDANTKAKLQTAPPRTLRSRHV